MKANKSSLGDRSRKAEPPVSTRQSPLPQGIGNPEGSKVLSLIVAIKENLVKENKHELTKNLHELSVCFRPQEHEKTQNQHNDRIVKILGWMKNRSVIDWNNPIEVLGVLRNEKGISLETTDTMAMPNIGMVMNEPTSHNGSLGTIRTDACLKREIILLKIYGISMERINAILRKH